MCVSVCVRSRGESATLIVKRFRKKTMELLAGLQEYVDMWMLHEQAKYLNALILSKLMLGKRGTCKLTVFGCQCCSAAGGS